MNTTRGLKTKESLVNEIILLKKGNNRLTAGDIRGELLGCHPGSKSIPKERAIYKILERNKGKTIPSDLDTPWSLGSCLKYDISADAVIPIQRQLLPYEGRFLTIRRTRWYSILHPVIFPLLEKEYPEQLDENQWRLYQIASYYTRAEQIAEIRGEDYPDTQFLDNKFIFEQDFSFKTNYRLWNHMYKQIPEKPAKVTPLASGLNAEQILAKQITADEARLLNEFINMQCDYEADDEDLEKAIILVEENPGIQPVAEKWMALNLRRDIRIIKKEGEE